MAEFTFLREQLPTGELELIEFGPGWSYEDALNRPGALHAQMSLTSDYATEEKLDPWRTGIYALRDGVIEWGGILLPPSLGLGDTNLSIDCFGWLGYWDHRRIRWALAPFAPDGESFTNTDQFEIFEALIADAQLELMFGDGYDLGITVTYDALSGVLRDRTEDYYIWKAKNLGEALRQLAAVEDGFDFAMEYTLNTTTDRIDKAIKLFYPTKGRDTGFVFEYERDRATNILKRGFSDPIDFAWTGDGWGSGNDATRLRSIYVDETLRGIYPPYEASPSWSSVTEQATLDEHTAGAFARTKRPLRLPQWQVDPDASPSWGDWVTGDTVTAKVTDGYGSTTPVTGDQYRITGWKVAESGEHFVTPGAPVAPEGEA